MFEFIGTIPVIGGTLGLILPFLIVLSIVVFIHEYGHYIVGRWCGIHAETFSVGFGPVLTSWIDKRGTKWQIAAIPLGGYVKFLGDMNASSTQTEGEADDLDPDQLERRFFGAKLYKRALTVFAGPAANFILSTTLFAGLVWYQGMVSSQPVLGKVNSEIQKQFDLKAGDRILEIDNREFNDFQDLSDFASVENTKSALPYLIERDGTTLEIEGPFPFLPLVGSVTPVSPASKAGLKSGDLIQTIGGIEVQSFAQLRNLIFGSEPGAREITVSRNGNPLSLTIDPHVREIPNAEGGFEKQVSIGVVAGLPFSGVVTYPNPLMAIEIGAERTWIVIRESIKNIGLIISGALSVNNLQGVVGIAHVSGEIAKTGTIEFITLIAFVSTAIGFLNLLPIPVLDGGHLAMFGYEALTGKAPNDSFLHYSTVVALSLLLTLMVFVTFNDIVRLALYWF